jgi:predicted MFS family arabinose efflux permease
MKKPLRLLLVLVVTIPLGYFFRETFGREATYWLVGGLAASAMVLKFAEFRLQRSMKAQETKMSPGERRESERVKKDPP